MKRRLIDQSYTLIDITVDQFDNSIIDTIKAKYPMIAIGRSEINRYNSSLGNNLKFFITHLYFDDVTDTVNDIKKYYYNYSVKVHIVK